MEKYLQEVRSFKKDKKIFQEGQKMVSRTNLLIKICNTLC